MLEKMSFDLFLMMLYLLIDAVVAAYSPASDPIHKATIIPRGRALGMVMRLPEGDRVSMAKDKLYADLRVACGGRIAEDMIFGKNKVTTG